MHVYEVRPRAQVRARIVFDCPDDSGVFFWGSRHVDNGPSRFPVYEELSGLAASGRGFPPAKSHSRYGRQGGHQTPASRESWTVSRTNEVVVVEVPYGGLAGGRLVK